MYTVACSMYTTGTNVLHLYILRKTLPPYLISCCSQYVCSNVLNIHMSHPELLHLFTCSAFCQWDTNYLHCLSILFKVTNLWVDYNIWIYTMLILLFYIQQNRSTHFRSCYSVCKTVCIFKSSWVSYGVKKGLFIEMIHLLLFRYPFVCGVWLCQRCNDAQ